MLVVEEDHGPKNEHIKKEETRQKSKCSRRFLVVQKPLFAVVQGKPPSGCPVNEGASVGLVLQEVPNCQLPIFGGLFALAS
jgi:hypothetical protein